MKRVLVTGASGFIGSATIFPLLRFGFEVHCLGRSAPTFEGVTFHRFDLLADDPARLIRRISPTHLLHLAWHDERATIWHSHQNSAWSAASLRLANAFRCAGGRRAVFAGSAAQYDWSEPLLDDNNPRFLPSTPYGQAKQATWSLLSGGAFAPVSIGWAIIFFPFGPRDNPDKLLSAVIDGLSSGETVSCSAGDQVRPFIYVDDVGLALATLLGSSVEGPVNIALDEACSVRQIALRAAALLGDPSRVTFGSRPLQPGEPAEMRATTRRLREEVGFAPEYSIAQGVEATVRARWQVCNADPSEGPGHNPKRQFKTPDARRHELRDAFAFGSSVQMIIGEC